MAPRMKVKDIVLVVDDSPETLGFLTDALESSGITVLIAQEGERALNLVDEIAPDVVLMDAVMPGMDGFTTCRLMKSKPSMAHAPVIFMTGLSETEHIVKGFQAGGVDYLTKPINPDELIARMHVHIANARLAQSARMALDTTGRSLLAVDEQATVLWYTPQACKLLETAIPANEAGLPILSGDVRTWLSSESARRNALILRNSSQAAIELSYVGRISPGQMLLRLVKQAGTGDQTALRERLSLTPREAEVLLWVARGKPTRDIAEILGLSYRTVNKHLELIYAKLGVENRAAAAALAVRTIMLE